MIFEEVDSTLRMPYKTYVGFMSRISGVTTRQLRHLQISRCNSPGANVTASDRTYIALNSGCKATASLSATCGVVFGEPDRALHPSVMPIAQLQGCVRRC